MVRLGDYATAVLVEKRFTEDYPDGLHEPRQGVYVKNNHDGTIVLQGENGQYLCKGPKEVTIVPDANLSPDTLEFVLKQRRKLGIR